MATDEIAALSGRELDAAVAIRCFGWEKRALGYKDPDGVIRSAGFIPRYSDSNCTGLPLVLAWLREQGWLVVLTQYKHGCEVELKRTLGDRFGRYQATGETLPIAVARVALMSVEAKLDEFKEVEAGEASR